MFTACLVLELLRRMLMLFSFGRLLHICSSLFASFHGCSMLCLPENLLPICQHGIGKFVVEWNHTQKFSGMEISKKYILAVALLLEKPVFQLSCLLNF